MPPTPEELAALLPQYCIESMLGHGGMGAVYKGMQPDLDRPVAIKVLAAELFADEQFVSRFKREARTLAKLHHPGIVGIYDFGQTSEGHLYFVMEYIDGTDLRRVIQSTGLNPEQALAATSQICDALQYAHQRGVVHRDIKPANILLTSEGDVKLADFGLSRPVQEEDSGGLTVSNMVMGTPDYMSPEQRTGYSDHRTDIYALGVTLYEMLTGRPPHGAFVSPSRKVQVDFRIDEVVLKALQEEPERRYQQVSELKSAVDHIRTRTFQSVEAAAQLRVTVTPPRRSKVSMMAGGLLVLAVLTGAGWFAWSKYGKPATPAPQAAITEKSASALHSYGPTPAQSFSSIPPTEKKDGQPAIVKSQTTATTEAIEAASVVDPARWEKAIDLLPLIDLNRDVLKGKWKLKENGLASDTAVNARIEIPYQPPDEYDFLITFTRLQGNEGVAQILYKAARSFEWSMGPHSSGSMGFMCIDGKTDNLTTVRKPDCIVNNRRYTSIVSVRNGSVSAYLDGVLVDHWKTDYHEMGGPWPGMELRHEARLGIGTWASPTVFHSVKVLEVTGKGTNVSEGTASSTTVTGAMKPTMIEPAATPTPVSQATPVPAADLMAWVLAKREHWPKEVRLTKALLFPVLIDGHASGTILAPAGTIGKVMNVTAGQVTIEWLNNSTAAPMEATDFMERAPVEMARARSAEPMPTANAEAVPVTNPTYWEKAINLMPLINLNRDVLAGTWKAQEDGLVSDATPYARIEIPYHPPEEYDFLITFTMLQGNGGVHQILYKAGRSFEWIMGAHSNSVMGFTGVDGKWDDATVIRKPNCIVNNQRYTCVVSVRNHSVAAYLDGVLVERWKTDYHELGGPYKGMELRNPTYLGIGTWGASTVFHSAKVIESKSVPSTPSNR